MRQPGVDDLVDDDDVAAGDLHVEVLEEADRLVAAHLGAAVAGELDEVERVGIGIARERSATNGTHAFSEPTSSGSRPA